MPRALKSVTFVYMPREDRILIAINAGRPDAWSCWLTRRLALAVIERTTDYIASNSDLAQRAPAELRGDMIAFERDAAIAKTAPSMSNTPGPVLTSTAAAAELADRLTISQHGEAFRLELRGQADEGAAGMLKRAELQRLLQMLQVEIGKAAWLAPPAKPQATAAPAAADTKPARH
ncbi:MAG: hypothetical protein WCA56_12695 [Xanthobacteraceae bacterium]|jgi:hypothetical protein